MTLKQIDELVQRRDSLSPKQRKALVRAILKNREARQVACSGALVVGNYSLACKLL